MTATDPAFGKAAQDASEAARAARLEDEVRLLSRRLHDAETARARSESDIAALSREVEGAREERRLWVRRALGPLLAAERAIRWVFEKGGRAAGMAARHVIFRGKRTKRDS